MAAKNYITYRKPEAWRWWLTSKCVSLFVHYIICGSVSTCMCETHIIACRLARDAYKFTCKWQLIFKLFTYLTRWCAHTKLCTYISHHLPVTAANPICLTVQVTITHIKCRTHVIATACSWRRKQLTELAVGRNCCNPISGRYAVAFIALPSYS